MARRRQLAVEEDANQMVFGPEFQDEQCLLISEVKVLLEVNVERKKASNQNIPDIMTKTIQYCTKFSRFSNKQSVKDVRSLFPDSVYHNFEMAQLANLTCESSEEAKFLVPSLDRIDDFELQTKLQELNNYLQFQ